jgi:hypothetical protein
VCSDIPRDSASSFRVYPFTFMLISRKKLGKCEEKPQKTLDKSVNIIHTLYIPCRHRGRERLISLTPRLSERERGW